MVAVGVAVTTGVAVGAAVGVAEGLTVGVAVAEGSGVVLPQVPITFHAPYAPLRSGRSPCVHH